jgi:putative membrane protein
MTEMMSYGHGYGMGGGMWLLTILFWVIFLAGVYLVLRGLLDKKSGPGSTSHPIDESALSILQKRFARGDIDEETFKRMKQGLEE